jgi:hypothetical protein
MIFQDHNMPLSCENVWSSRLGLTWFDVLRLGGCPQVKRAQPRGPRRPWCCGIDVPLADGTTRRRRAGRRSRPRLASPRLRDRASRAAHGPSRRPDW